jgi:superoxide dismutase, Fe-Mn family
MFILPKLSFGFDALEPSIDAQTMEIHHGKHHATYVKNLNDLLPDRQDTDLEDILKDLNSIPENIRTKVRNNGGGHYNHSLFWQMLAPASGQAPEGKLLEAINTTFGDISTFQKKFRDVALGRFGSGWAWLTAEDGRLAIMDTPNQDNPIMEGKTPILGLDVWEHAYYIKYQNRRAEYIENFWKIVNWKFVSKRLI